MFQVIVVENVDERHMRTAGWAFPLYVFLISLFVLPIGIAGLALLPDGSNPDMFVLTVPLASGQNGLALFAFLGGFSAATSMVIVSSIALSTMVSNHLVMPAWLYFNRDANISAGDVRNVLLAARRISIGGILALGFLYFLLSGGTGALASIGLIAFAGLAQLLPTLLAGMFWRHASRTGAIAGVCLGALFWAYTLFLPSFEGSVLLSKEAIETGLFGISALRPQALFGLEGVDPLVHSLFWSLSINTFALITGSLISNASDIERLQATHFVDVFRRAPSGPQVTLGRTATSEDLFTLAQRILGATTAHRLFAEEAFRQGKTQGLPDPVPAFIEALERQLSGSVGSASAHAMINQVAGGATLSVDDLMNIADETAEILEYSQKLETQSKELADTAAQLRAANARLQALSDQKDAFLSQVSHELRTPMTSIRSFTEILENTEDLEETEAQRFIGIIGQESARLTRILDEILDLSFLESGKARWKLEPVRAFRRGRARASGHGGPRRSGAPPDRDGRGRRHTPCHGQPGPAGSGLHQPLLERAEIRRRDRTQDHREGRNDRRARADRRGRQWPGHSARRPGQGVREILPPRAHGPRGLRRARPPHQSRDHAQHGRRSDPFAGRAGGDVPARPFPCESVEIAGTGLTDSPKSLNFGSLANKPRLMGRPITAHRCDFHGYVSGCESKPGLNQPQMGKPLSRQKDSNHDTDQDDRARGNRRVGPRGL